MKGLECQGSAEVIAERLEGEIGKATGLIEVEVMSLCVGEETESVGMGTEGAESSNQLERVTGCRGRDGKRSDQRNVEGRFGSTKDDEWWGISAGNRSGALVRKEVKQVGLEEIKGGGRRQKKGGGGK
jgi:hypothetical protein